MDSGIGSPKGSIRPHQIMRIIHCIDSAARFEQSLDAALESGDKKQLVLPWIRGISHAIESHYEGGGRESIVHSTSPENLLDTQG